MKATLRDTLRNLTSHFKTLLYFELLYRALGVLVIFPFAQFLFFQSIRISGYPYITNAMLFEYLTHPFTIISMLLLLMLLGLYMMIEMVMLSFIFDYGRRDVVLGFKDLILGGGKKVIQVLKRYHLHIFFPAFFFFVIVELFHIVGIAQTINVPDELVLVLKNYAWVNYLFYGLLVGVFILFIETIFSINLLAVDGMTVRDARYETKRMLKGKRIEMMIEFIIINIVLNVILYLFYALLILLVGWFVSLLKGEFYALSVVLTVFYSLYVVVGFVATITLIPINYALITAWFEEGRKKEEALPPSSVLRLKMKPFQNERYFKWGLIVVLCVMFGLNLNAVYHAIQNPSQFELLKITEIVSHRGQSVDAPENTLASIELALSHGVDAVEIDVRETKDKIPILMHDSSTKRTTNDIQTRLVKNLTLEELRLLDAGSWFSNDFMGEKIPTLEEVLITVSGRARLFLELKDRTPTLEQSVMDLIESYDMVEDTVILSFDSQQLKRIKLMQPEIKTLLLIQSFYGDLRELARATYADYYGLSITFFDNNTTFLSHAHEYDKKVYIWTVKDQAIMRRMVEADVDGLITDRPVLAREVVYSKNAPELLIEILKRFFKTYEQGLL